MPIKYLVTYPLWWMRPKILFGVGSGNYKVDVQICQRPPDILAVEGNQVTQSFRGMRKTCYKCFGCGHTASVCKKENLHVAIISIFD